MRFVVDTLREQTVVYTRVPQGSYSESFMFAFKIHISTSNRGLNVYTLWLSKHGLTLSVVDMLSSMRCVSEQARNCQVHDCKIRVPKSFCAHTQCVYLRCCFFIWQPLKWYDTIRLRPSIRPRQSSVTP